MRKKKINNIKHLGKGCNSEFLKTRIINPYVFDGDLNLPKPHSQGELKILSNFIFGVDLTVRFEYKYDKLKEISHFNKLEAQRHNRKIKLIKISLPDSEIDYVPDKNGKMELMDLRYFCNQKHSDYYDNNFNHIVFGSCYELDSYFWRHCIGKLRCGGIASYSYGQVSIYSIKEYLRLINFSETDLSVREEFKIEIETLKELNSKFDSIL